MIIAFLQHPVRALFRAVRAVRPALAKPSSPAGSGSAGGNPRDAMNFMNIVSGPSRLIEAKAAS